MAEIMIALKEGRHADPGAKARNCYYPGDIVEVRPDGFDWGRPVKSFFPKFALVKIPGLPAEAIAKYRDVDPDPALLGRLRRRRRFKVDLKLLPRSALAAINQTGEVTISPLIARAYIRDKITGLLEG